MLFTILLLKRNKKQHKLYLSFKREESIKKLLPFINHLRSVGYRDIEEDDFKVFLNVLDKIWMNYQQCEVLPLKINKSK